MEGLLQFRCFFLKRPNAEQPISTEAIYIYQSKKHNNNIILFNSNYIFEKWIRTVFGT